MEAFSQLIFPHPRLFYLTTESSHHLWEMRQKENIGPSSTLGIAPGISQLFCRFFEISMHPTHFAYFSLYFPILHSSPRKHLRSACLVLWLSPYAKLEEWILQSNKLQVGIFR